MHIKYQNAVFIVENSSRIISYSIHLKKLRRRHKTLLVVLSVTVCRKFGRVTQEEAEFD